MLFERPEIGDRAVILQIVLKREVNPEQAEFAELAKSAGIDVVAAILAPRDAPNPQTYVGKGKVAEVKLLLRQSDADLLLVNHELNAGQQRNLEQALDCRVITRTELILTIFADRARSHEGQLQVELAQLKHAQTRLVRGWTHLDRQKGGIGLRGAGEKQIEMDQRMLSERVKAMEKKLLDVEKRRAQNRRGRYRRGVPTVTLVGYTNAGKSTLFNRLAGADVYAEDQLFATLDPTTRKIVIPGLTDVVLADTVGFVSLLPHALIEAFKATLEEVAQADLLVHVVDASDPLMNERVGQVRQVLRDIGAGSVAEVVALNKTDLVDQYPHLEPCDLGRRIDVIPVSALTGNSLDRLITTIGDSLGVASPHEVVLDSADGKTRAWLYRSGAVLDEVLLEDGSLQLTLQADNKLIDQLENSPQVLLRTSTALPRISD
ncbi:MAG: GTPase HflX [Pseudomonadales bacterium]|nr:GTPase HflX [Pseudomonadales bacterium]